MRRAKDLFISFVKQSFLESFVTLFHYFNKRALCVAVYDFVRVSARRESSLIAERAPHQPKVFFSCFRYFSL